jgi:hypothetical protein
MISQNNGKNQKKININTLLACSIAGLFHKMVNHNTCQNLAI